MKKMGIESEGDMGSAEKGKSARGRVMGVGEKG